MTPPHVQRITLEWSTDMTPLRQCMLEDMQIRNFSQNTQNSYLQQGRSSPGTSADRPKAWDLRTSGRTRFT
jgi:hypothetical protein